MCCPRAWAHFHRFIELTRLGKALARDADRFLAYFPSPVSWFPHNEKKTTNTQSHPVPRFLCGPSITLKQTKKPRKLQKSPAPRPAVILSPTHHHFDPPRSSYSLPHPPQEEQSLRVSPRRPSHTRIQTRLTPQDFHRKFQTLKVSTSTIRRRYRTCLWRRCFHQTQINIFTDTTPLDTKHV